LLAIMFEHSCLIPNVVRSMYSVFTAEHAYTSSEKGVGVLGELVVGFIYGSLAGVISNVMVTLGVGQQDTMLKLLSLKAWMKSRNLKKGDKVKILAVFNQMNDGAPFDEKQVQYSTAHHKTTLIARHCP
jgi:hypothetical protein